MTEQVNKENITQPEEFINGDEVINNRENITRYLPFIFFLSGLMLVYIYLSHRTERKIRKADKLNREVKELYSEYITLQTEILNGSRSSSLEQKMQKQGIKPAVEPPIQIK